jgi:hypothetical protein
MGVILNPRGIAGSGKTELARRIIGHYCWGAERGITPLWRDRCDRPLGYLLRHPHGGRPLAVLGHYERLSGGVNTVTLRDGGLDAVFRLADHWALEGCDVLLEGASLSTEVWRTSDLARRHRVQLATPPAVAARQLAARRRQTTRALPAIFSRLAPQGEAVREACEELASAGVPVATLPFDVALDPCRSVLRLEPARGLLRSSDADVRSEAA